MRIDIEGGSLQPSTMEANILLYIDHTFKKWDNEIKMKRKTRLKLQCSCFISKLNVYMQTVFGYGISHVD